MSDAKVRFLTLDHQPAHAGEEVRFGFVCPKRGTYCSGALIANKTPLKRNGQNKDGGVAMWDWDGNVEAPTFKPSMNCKGCWHGYIEKGRCVNTDHVDEPEPPVRNK